MLNPERSMEIQALLGSDIIMALRSTGERRPTAAKTQEAAMARSMRWAARSRDAFAGTGALFGNPAGRARRRAASGLG